MKREEIARVAHEVNRAYCEALGDQSQLTWEDAPEWQKKSAVMGVEQINAHPDTTPEQSHQGWLKVKQEDGWSWGPVKDPDKKQHPCFCAYGDLPENQQLKDEMFGIVVHAVLGI